MAAKHEYLTVIVPNYNHARYLEQRLSSIFNQTCTDFELIILDDKSTDDSLTVINQVVDKYAHKGIEVRIMANDVNTGSPFAQWGRGIDAAKADYIWIAESDDFADEHFVETVLAQIKAHDLDLCFCQSIVVDSDGVQIDRFPDEPCLVNNPIFTFDDIKADMGTHNIVPNASAVVFRKQLALPLLERIKPYRMSGDWLFWALLIKSSHRCGYIAEAHNYYRRHMSSTSAQASRQHKHLREAFAVLRQFKANSMPYNKRYWIDKWLKINGYNIKSIISNDFAGIFCNIMALEPTSVIYIIKQILTNSLTKRGK